MVHGCGGAESAGLRLTAPGGSVHVRPAAASLLEVGLLGCVSGWVRQLWRCGCRHGEHRCGSSHPCLQAMSSDEVEDEVWSACLQVTRMSSSRTQAGRTDMPGVAEGCTWAEPGMALQSRLAGVPPAQHEQQQQHGKDRIRLQVGVHLQLTGRPW